MNYLEYVVAAYAVFAIVLVWDFLSPRLQIRKQLRAARNRATRATRAQRQTHTGELSR